MTVVAGYTDGKTWAIASDSGCYDTDSDTFYLATDAKIWKAGDSLVGVAGDMYVLQLVRESGLSTALEIQKFLLDKDIKGTDDLQWDVLVVTRTYIDYMGDDFGIMRNKANYCAVGGAGASLGLGALAMCSIQKMNPLDAVRMSVKVSLRHSTFADGDIKALSLPEVKKPPKLKKEIDK